MVGPDDSYYMLKESMREDPPSRESPPSGAGNLALRSGLNDRLSRPPGSRESRETLNFQEIERERFIYMQRIGVEKMYGFTSNVEKEEEDGENKKNTNRKRINGDFHENTLRLLVSRDPRIHTRAIYMR